jgi:hypothetical protein
MERSVVEGVFCTPKLLESILIKLSPEDVLVNAQKVPRTWNATIRSSPALQQRLFSVPTYHSSAPESH